MINHPVITPAEKRESQCSRGIHHPLPRLPQINTKVKIILPKRLFHNESCVKIAIKNRYRKDCNGGDGRVSIDKIVAYFRDFYEDRKARGLTPEKPNSIFAKSGYTDAEARRNILSNPFRRFEDMQMLHHTKTLGIIEVEPTVRKHLTDDEKAEILRICDEKSEKYFERISGEKN